MNGFELLAWIVVPGTFAVAVFICCSCILAIVKKYCGGRIWPLQYGKKQKVVEIDSVSSAGKNKAWVKDFAVPVLDCDDDGRV
ncbi:unnamed protein product [Orchesella dallaii]|uniref:Uncharacterized protein n=1 Tax=Orchesella dallaii TaxID=48710 RepID=A0ABP1RY55_9HEXA